MCDQSIQINSTWFKVNKIPLLKVNLGLGREDCQRALIDEFLCMVTGCALGTDVCHWILTKSQHGSRSTRFPFKLHNCSRLHNSSVCRGVVVIMQPFTQATRVKVAVTSQIQNHNGVQRQFGTCL